MYLPEGHENAVKFNSTQRAHQNYLENMTSVQIILILNGFIFPGPSAIIGIIWIFGRIVFLVGYIQKPAMRFPGFMIHMITMKSLEVMLFFTASRILKYGDVP